MTAYPGYHTAPKGLGNAGAAGRLQVRRAVATLVRDNRFEMPPFPAVAREIYEVSNRPTASMDELASIAHRDAFIAGRILRIANSAHYGFRQPATTLRDGIVRIGTKELRNILFVLGMKGGTFRAEGFSAIAEAAWQHSLTCAIAASMLATYTGRAERHRAFLAGLVHDVGVPVVLKAFVQLVKTKKVRHQEAVKAYASVAEALHAEAGGLVSGRWRLDDGLKDVISQHHHPERATCERDLVFLVAVADEAARRAAVEAEGAEEETALEEHPSVAVLGLSSAQLTEFSGSLPLRVADYESVIR